MGPSASFFQAYDEQLRSTVALKVLKPELTASPTGPGSL